MPKRFTPEQFAASAAAGEPRSEQFFSGDSGAWHAYQESLYSTEEARLNSARSCTESVAASRLSLYSQSRALRKQDLGDGSPFLSDSNSALHSALHCIT